MNFKNALDQFYLILQTLVTMYYETGSYGMLLIKEFKKSEKFVHNDKIKIHVLNTIAIELR